MVQETEVELYRKALERVEESYKKHPYIEGCMDRGEDDLFDILGDVLYEFGFDEIKLCMRVNYEFII